ncbi:sigma-70 family RNA polymerase sigma factor [Microvirga massiliensis]|uniref:sigma-70 family RNA polymerase sigma factor n=1 Tax=Microvirga massiliensis TaxID=1033741 RepID=UPI00093DEEA4|nr:sigma-70 family RNA polymerase sigma factor [Microvirga massiliensis]
MTVETSLRDGMLAALPNLRAFAVSLTNDPVQADDLVQDTILRAWANSHRFEPGTNLHAWLFTILRNLFLSDYRKRKREIEDVDGSYAGMLITPADQHDHLDFEDFRAALAKLRVDQREALLLVAAEGMSYEEAAEVCGVAVGTVKSRVNRARHRLALLLGLDGTPELGPDNVAKAALGGFSFGSPAQREAPG